MEGLLLVLLFGAILFGLIIVFIIIDAAFTVIYWDKKEHDLMNETDPKKIKKSIEEVKRKYLNK